MEYEDNLNTKKLIFGSFFLLANKLQSIGDQLLGEFTTKQWFLTAVVESFGETHPTLSEVSKVVGSSRQNVKQLAIKLEDKGFLLLEKDEQDSRVLRLTLTEKCKAYWKDRQVEDEQFVKALFADLSDDEINSIFGGIKKIYQKISEISLEISREDEKS